MRNNETIESHGNNLVIKSIFISFCSVFLIGISYLVSVNIISILINYFSDINVITLKAEESINSILYLMGILCFIIVVPTIYMMFRRSYVDALYIKEVKMLNKFPLLYCLSLIGCFFGAFVSIKIMIPFMIKYNNILGIANTITLHNLIKIIVLNSLTFFIIFHIPFFIKTLVSFDLVSIDFLKSKRKIIFFISMFLGAVFSPTELFTMFIISIPIYLSYEIGILISKSKKKINGVI